jgi:hypothetical protein
MGNDLKIKKLKIFLRVYGVLTVLIFGTLLVAFAFKLSDFNPGHTLHWMIWDDVQGHVGPMIVIIYLVWGAFFFLAAGNPVRYLSFLRFTMWANLAHGLSMIPMALEGTHMYTSKFITDIPFILILAVGIYLWIPDDPKIENSEVIR